MADDARAIRSASDRVEVVDAAHRLHGKSGRVAFFVGDNIHVHIDGVRWPGTKMFFADQLRALPGGASETFIAAPLRLVRRLQLSLARIRLF